MLVALRSQPCGEEVTERCSTSGGAEVGLQTDPSLCTDPVSPHAFQNLVARLGQMFLLSIGWDHRPL